jgi:glycerol-3-phosphate dehydrogenase
MFFKKRHQRGIDGIPASPYCGVLISSASLTFIRLNAYIMSLNSKQAATPKPTRRVDLFQALKQDKVWDLVVVGGGATGLGIALDAVTRGLTVALLESHDFAHGTSSRSTKLIHGGVRYVAQGRLGLVREALRERAILLRNAPHLVQPLPFVMPAYHWWERPFYGAGLLAYDMLAGKAGLGHTRWLSAAQTLAALPTVTAHHLKGGVQYWDAQFDDARLAIAIARTAALHGALLINYCPVKRLLYRQGSAQHSQLVDGVECQDQETGDFYSVRARCVINAAGVWVDQLRQQDAQATQQHDTHHMVLPSQGAHIVVHQSFLPQGKALMVPKTHDGRVLFAIPWLGHVVIGTTDTECQQPEQEPRPLQQEVDFILKEISLYLDRPPTRSDVLSMWAGLRPLVQSAPQSSNAGATIRAPTSTISREHAVMVDVSGLVSVAGGKWTTYRAMAEDVLDQCVKRDYWPEIKKCITDHTPLIGAPDSLEKVAHPLSAPAGVQNYGQEIDSVQALPGNDVWVVPGFSEAMVRFAVRNEYARSVEDVLARRSRLLFVNATAAIQVASVISAILQDEGIRDTALEPFLSLAQHYLSPKNE